MSRHRKKISRSLRTKLYLNGAGRCTNCGCLLEAGWHTDHYIPIYFGGTNVEGNLRPLCPTCNTKKGYKIMNKLTPHDYENMTLFRQHFPKSKGMRIAQEGAYNCIGTHLLSNQLTCSAFLPTGVGKSDLIRALALGLRSKFAGVWAFSPNYELQRQLAKDKVTETLERLGQNFSYSPFMVEDRLDTPRFRNNCVLESFTTQFLISNNNVDYFIESSKKIRRETGKLPIAVFDESHLFSTDNQWGHKALQMHKNGIPIVLVTGTPFRSDKLQIPGFNLTEINSINRKFARAEASDDPTMIKVLRGNLKVMRYLLEADYEYSYQRAWEAGVILKPNPIFIDATDDVYGDVLSEMSKNQSERILRNFLMDERTIRSAVESIVKSLTARKKVDPRAAAIVATLSDELDELNNDPLSMELADIHAKKVAREFKRLSNFRVLVVTSNTEEMISDFKDKDYDVLIVKAMGTIGFNHPPIKTVANLSPYRTLPAIIQLAMRGCRLYAGMKNFDFIMPKDEGMKQLWLQFQEVTGLIVEKVEITDCAAEEKEKKEKDSSDDNNDHPTWSNHNRTYDPIIKRSKADEIVEMFQEKLPTLYTSLTIQGMLDHHAHMSQSFGEDWFDKLKEEVKSEIIDSNEEESRLRSSAEEIRKELTGEVLRIVKLPYDRYGDVARAMSAWVKRKCGFHTAQSLDNLSGIDNFRRIVDAGKELRGVISQCNDEMDLKSKGMPEIFKNRKAKIVEIHSNNQL